MGQQQLLLLVLATVIVGLATVAGIQAFDQGSTRANQDALSQTAVKIASDIQSNLQEPTQFGGAGIGSMSQHETGDTPTLEALGYDTKSSPGPNADFTPAVGGVYDTADGECGISSNSAGAVDVTCESADNEVVVTLDGLDSDGISTTTITTKS